MVDWCVLVPADLLLGDAQFMHNGTVAKKRVRVMGASLVPTLEAFCRPATVQGGILRVRESAG
jgi:hypothetical protein